MCSFVVISHVDKSDVWQFNMLNAGLVLSLSYLPHLRQGWSWDLLSLTPLIGDALLLFVTGVVSPGQNNLIIMFPSWDDGSDKLRRSDDINIVLITIHPAGGDNSTQSQPISVRAWRLGAWAQQWPLALCLYIGIGQPWSSLRLTITDARYNRYL